MTRYEVRLVSDETRLAHAHSVRRAVFIDEQGVPEHVEMDDRDETATHIVIYETEGENEVEAGSAVATARIRFPEEGVAKPERVAVQREYRGDGLGRWLMALVEDEAREAGCHTATLNAQESVVEFYENLGYEVVSEVFEEAGIPHVEMEKSLT